MLKVKCVSVSGFQCIYNIHKTRSLKSAICKKKKKIEK